MLLANNEAFTIERAPDGSLILTCLATGESITLTERDLYPLNDVIVECLEALEGEEETHAPNP